MTDPASVDPSQRGGLSIAGRVIDKLSVQAASTVPGVVSTTGMLERLVDRRLPKATSDVRGQTARVGLEIAVSWPLPLSEVAADVRAAVTTMVSTLSGLAVSAVDVSVARVVWESDNDTRRVE